MSGCFRLLLSVVLIIGFMTGKALAFNLQVGDFSVTYTDLGDGAPVYNFTAANNIFDWITFSDCSLDLTFTPDSSTVFEPLTLTDTYGTPSTIAPHTSFTLGPASTIDTGAYGYGTIASAVFTASVGPVDGVVIGNSRFYSTAQTITATLVPSPNIVETWFDVVPLQIVGELRETGPAPVPEPGTSLLVGAGLIGLAWSVRRHRS